MDPVTIVTSVAKITSTCLTTGKIIYDFSCKYQDAPRNILAISTEATVISASLSQIQALILSKQDPEQVLRSRPEIAATLDASLTGCMVLFSCLDEELREVSRYAHAHGREKLSWKGKVKTVWKQETFQELLDGIRGQQLAINTLIQLLQIDSLSEIKELLLQKAPALKETIQRTESLRRSYPSVKVAESIYKEEDRMTVYSAADSMMPSELEFAFDDVIVNSVAYRRVLAAARYEAAARHDASAPQCEEDVGDLIDFSDDGTLRQAPISAPAENLVTIPKDLLGLRFSIIDDEPIASSYPMPDRQGVVEAAKAAQVPAAKQSLLQTATQHTSAKRKRVAAPSKDIQQLPRTGAHDRIGSATSRHDGTPSTDDEERTMRPDTPDPRRPTSPRPMPEGTHILLICASLFEFSVDKPNKLRKEAGYPYLTYVQGEVFDVIAQKGELWLAKNQDDSTNTLGWIWEEHFVILSQD